MASLPPVARSVYVFCKKCDTDRYFKVITHTSPTTAKLKCEVCHTHRSYSPDDEAKAAAPKKAGVRAKGTSAQAKSRAASQWLTLKDTYKGPDAVDYAISARFDTQQSLVHPTFGLGFVTKTYPNKIEVVFSEGVKELLHGRK